MWNARSKSLQDGQLAFLRAEQLANISKEDFDQITEMGQQMDNMEQENYWLRRELRETKLLAVDFQRQLYGQEPLPSLSLQGAVEIFKENKPRVEPKTYDEIKIEINHLQMQIETLQLVSEKQTQLVGNFDDSEKQQELLRAIFDKQMAQEKLKEKLEEMSQSSQVEEENPVQTIRFLRQKQEEIQDFLKSRYLQDVENVRSLYLVEIQQLIEKIKSQEELINDFYSRLGPEDQNEEIELNKYYLTQKKNAIKFDLSQGKNTSTVDDIRNEQINTNLIEKESIQYGNQPALDSGKKSDDLFFSSEKINQSSIEAWRSQIGEKERSISMMQESIQILQNKLEQQLYSNEQKEQEFTALEESLKNQLNLYQEELDKKSADLADQKNAFEQLSQKNKSLKQEIEQLKRDGDQSAKKIQQFQQQASEIQSIIEEKRQLEKERKELQNQINKLSNDLSKANQQNTKLTEQNEQQKAQIKELKSQLKTSQDLNQKLSRTQEQGQNSIQKEQIAALNKQVKDLQQESKKQDNESQKQVKQLSKDIETKQREIDKLNAKIKKLEQQTEDKKINRTDQNQQQTPQIQPQQKPQQQPKAESLNTMDDLMEKMESMMREYDVNKREFESVLPERCDEILKLL